MNEVTLLTYKSSLCRWQQEAPVERAEGRERGDQVGAPAVLRVQTGGESPSDRQWVQSHSLGSCFQNEGEEQKCAPNKQIFKVIDRDQSSRLPLNTTIEIDLTNYGMILSATGYSDKRGGTEPRIMFNGQL